MARYFFNRVDGHADPDPEGLELSSLSDARYEAILFAADTLKDTSYALWDGGEVRVEVTDDKQTLLFIVSISAVDVAILSQDDMPLAKSSVQPHDFVLKLPTKPKSSYRGATWVAPSRWTSRLGCSNRPVVSKSRA